MVESVAQQSTHGRKPVAWVRHRVSEMTCRFGGLVENGSRLTSGLMMKSIYVGNLPFTASEDEVRDLFAQYGEVNEVRLITDRDTGRPRGFGFVRMAPSDADSAIEALNGTELGGRTLRINEAQEREERRPRQPGRGPRRF